MKKNTDELILCMVLSGVAVAPMLGLWPLAGILAACATSLYLFKGLR